MGLLFLKQVKTGTVYEESSFLAGLWLGPWARIHTPGTPDFAPMMVALNFEFITKQ